MFFSGRGWTPRDGLYGIADRSIDPGLGLHGPIGIPELSTLDPEVRTIPIMCSIDCFSVTWRSKLFQVLANSSSCFSGWNDFGFTPKMWRSSMRSILKVFCLGRWWTPRDGLYGIADQLIDPGFGLHRPIGILELSTFDLQVCMIRIVYNIYSFSVTRRHKLLHVLANCSLGFWGWSDFCFTPKMWWCPYVLFGAWVDTSWRAIWHCRPINRSQFQSARANWHSRAVHPQSKKNRVSIKLKFDLHPAM